MPQKSNSQFSHSNEGEVTALSDAYKHEIIEYYNECQIDYEIVWHLKSHMSMHYGYYYPNTKRLREALINMNAELAKFGNINTNDFILDSGCGVGGSSIFLAKQYNAKTIGITLSEKQVANARDNAEKNGVSQCQFQVQNYLDTNFDNDTFDVVWAVESSCYAPDKIDFLKEAYRILKPGGKIVVADFFNNDDIANVAEEPLVKKMVKTWSIQSFAGANKFYEKMHTVGFNNCKKENVTQYVSPTVQRLYYASLIGLPVTYIGMALGLRNKRQTLNTWSTYYQYIAFKRKLWKYMFYAGTKPLI
jgi:cyclopropane fatty-acyl-phospholipid synthase-like methyltransferase